VEKSRPELHSDSASGLAPIVRYAVHLVSVSGFACVSGKTVDGSTDGNTLTKFPDGREELRSTSGGESPWVLLGLCVGLDDWSSGDGNAG
jgi:hypothetical protein